MDIHSGVLLNVRCIMFIYIIYQDNETSSGNTLQRTIPPSTLTEEWFLSALRIGFPSGDLELHFTVLLRCDDSLLQQPVVEEIEPHTLNNRTAFGFVVFIDFVNTFVHIAYLLPAAIVAGNGSIHSSIETREIPIWEFRCQPHFSTEIKTKKFEKHIKHVLNLAFYG